MSIKTAQENAPAVQTENALLGMKAGRPSLDELPPKPCGGIFLQGRENRAYPVG